MPYTKKEIHKRKDTVLQRLYKDDVREVKDLFPEMTTADIFRFSYKASLLGVEGHLRKQRKNAQK